MTGQGNAMVYDTRVEDHTEKHGLWVKREDLCCPPPGPPFSKMRGVIAHVGARPESVIGVLDTSHSQAGHAVAYACKVHGKKCVNFFPIRKADRDKPWQPQQIAARDLGAEMVVMKAGRSAILYHQARKQLHSMYQDEYLMPNALKLPEMIEETAAEAERTFDQHLFETCLIACSSATIAAGVMLGAERSEKKRLEATGGRPVQAAPRFILHMGYDRSEEAMTDYIHKMTENHPLPPFTLINEGYGYADKAKDGPDPDWPCNAYYDLKAYRWWMNQQPNTAGLKAEFGKTLMWNIG